METIYLDSLFIQELVTDYLLILCSARLGGLVLKRRRYLLAAALGAAYSAASYLPHLGFLSLPIMKLISALALCLAAFGEERQFFRCAVIFLAVSAAFGGVLLGLSLAGFRPSLDTRTLFLAFALCYAALTLLLQRRGRALTRRTALAEIELCGRRVSFRLLIDSGNCLVEPISTKAVLIASPHAIEPLLGEAGALSHLAATEFIEAASEVPELSGRLRLIPYSTLSGEGLLAAFIPDSALIDGKALELVVAISESACGDGFDGIL